MCLLLFTSLLGAQQKDELQTDISANTSIVNKYLWRGIVLADGPVWQSSATIATGGLSFNVWGNFELDDVNGKEYEWTEIDFTGEYSLDLEAVSLAVGALYYTFPNTDFDSTLEVYLTATLNSVLSPSVTLYKDMDLVEGMYLNFGISHSLEFEDTNYTIDLAAALGWGDEDHNGFYYGVSEAMLTDLLLSASMNMPLDANLTLVPMAAWSNLIDEDISDRFNESSHFIFGISANYTF